MHLVRFPGTDGRWRIVNLDYLTYAGPIAADDHDTGTSAYQLYLVADGTEGGNRALITNPATIAAIEDYLERHAITLPPLPPAPSQTPPLRDLQLREEPPPNGT